MSDSYQVSGTITRIGETEQKSATFSVRDIVLLTHDPKYPQPIPIQFANDKGRLIDEFAVGEAVVVDVNMRGREWQDKVFLNLDAWRIRRAEG